MEKEKEAKKEVSEEEAPPKESETKKEDVKNTSKEGEDTAENDVKSSDKADKEGSDGEKEEDGEEKAEKSTDESADEDADEDADKDEEPPLPTNEDGEVTVEELEKASKEELKSTIEKVADKAKKRDQGTEWVPRTRLGHMVRNGEISNMSQALSSGLPLREAEIVDVLLPQLADEVLDVNMVQRMTDSGRRVRFSITCVVGNGDGYVGLGFAKGKEVGPTIRKAIDNAKLNMIEIKRGCGHWECGCGNPHTLPFAVMGKCGSVEVHLKPAPRGVALSTGGIAQNILKLAGVQDVWGYTRGQTRTTRNYAKAVFEALRTVHRTKVSPGQLKELKIKVGVTGTSTVDFEAEARQQQQRRRR